MSVLRGFIVQESSHKCLHDTHKLYFFALLIPQMNGPLERQTRVSVVQWKKKNNYVCEVEYTK